MCAPKAAGHAGPSQQFIVFQWENDFWALLRHAAVLAECGKPMADRSWGAGAALDGSRFF
jgi:hypothetical protein